MTLKRNLILILFLICQVQCYANSSMTVFGYDTTIVKEWSEGNARYKVEITIKNAAGEDGVIPGQQAESYISIKQTKTVNNRTVIVLAKKDSCDAQMLQLVFYPGCLQLKDLNSDGKKELCLLYEFAGDGFDPRKVFYVLLEGGRLYRSVITVVYKESGFVVNTTQNRFASLLPKKFHPYLKREYNRIIKCPVE
jgi:hypothetical protein